MIDRIEFLGENAEKLILRDFTIIYGDTWKFTVELDLKWCKAKIDTEASVERILEWLNDLKKIEQKVEFINENGNFEINIRKILDDIYTINGLLSESMSNNSNVIFDFDIKDYVLDIFIKKLEQLVLDEY